MMAIPEYRELMSLKDRVALVTGASHGIGAAIAARLAEAGARTVVHYRSGAEAAENVAAAIRDGGGQALAVAAELACEDEVTALFATAKREFGCVDILVNNAGIYPVAGLLELTLRDWQAMQRANVDTAFLCTRAAARQMRGPGSGAVVNIASIEAMAAAPGHAHYASAKAAVVMLTRAAAQELGGLGIRVNAVSPGLIARPGIEEQWADGVERWRARAPLARLGQPEDVADACLFLVSPAARWISGHNLVVDGGVMAASAF